MSFVEDSIVCLFAIALFACTPASAPIIDYEGMQSLEEVDIFKAPPLLPTVGTPDGEFKTRLLIDTDGNLKKAIFLEGDKRTWRSTNKSLLSLKFSISPDAIPGPWELDMLFGFYSGGVYRGTGGSVTMQSFVAYRTAVKAISDSP
ncbi:MAG: hypothetical protein LBQ86_00010 [Holophagales bacterium]|jgi:hypothetical protein|nr:hypothetical protein [Holophagales bacterium]